MAATDAMTGRTPGGPAQVHVLVAEDDPLVRSLLVRLLAMQGWEVRAVADGLAEYVDKFVRRFYMHDASAADRLGPQTRLRMAEVPVAVARAQARALDTRREMVPLIAGFAGPVEVIVGAEDKVCPPSLHGPIAAALPGAVYTEIPACGHLATIEAPAAVNARIEALLERMV